MTFSYLFWRWTFVLTLLLPSSLSNAEPNILLITADDLGYGDLGGFGHPVIQTPNLDELAEDGLKFTNYYAPSALCSPSRAGLITGRHPYRTGIRSWIPHGSGVFLSRDEITLAETLRDAGYATSHIGKWHLKDKPSGFDHFNILPGQGRYHNPILKNNDNWEYGNKGGKEYKGFSSDVIMNESLKWLDQRDKEKPFMLMTHFKATHEPFDYPERFKNLFKNLTLPEPASLLDFDPDDSGRTFDGQILEILSERWRQASLEKNDRYPGLPFEAEGLDAVELRKKTYQKLIKDFLKSAAAIDDNIGRMLTYLDENDLTENTIVIYTSDQGYFLGEHGMFDKRMFLEESVRMPFVIRYPKEIPGDKRINDIILNIDFPSLLLDYAGIPQPEGFQGRSFRKNLKLEKTYDWRDKMYYRYYAHSLNRPAHFGIRTDRFKLIFYYGLSLGYKGSYTDQPSNPAWEFYDLDKDPFELKNQYKNPNYQKKINELKNELKKLRHDLHDSEMDSSELKNVIVNYW